jgi:hypothetical protein
MRAIRSAGGVIATSARLRQAVAGNAVVVTIDLASLETRVEAAPVPGCNGFGRDLSTLGRTERRR